MKHLPFLPRFFTILFLSFSISAVAQVDSLEQFIQETMEEYHIPGLAAAVINKEGICWEGYFGLANIPLERPVDASTIFYLGGVSAPVTSAALMKLFEEGYFDLDDDINGYLPFEVRHPFFPEDSITFRQLLNHEASIRDNWTIMQTTPGDSPISLDSFLFNYLHPDGSYYYPTGNYSQSYPPGSHEEYSNIGYALIGLLVEEIAQTPFNEYCNAHLFDEMEMPGSHWLLDETNPGKLAMPYWYSAGEYYAYGHYGIPWYPAAQLRSTARDLAHFLLTFIYNGKYGGNTVLDSSTIQLLTPSDFSDGLCWGVGDLGGHQYWGCGGAFLGARTGIAFKPQDSIGVVILMNSRPIDPPIVDIAIELFDFAYSDYCLVSSTSEKKQPVWADVFPNPGTGIFYIERSTNDPLEITLYDAMGQVVLPLHPLVAGQIDLSTVPAGMYFLELNDGQQSITKRIIKQ